MRLVIATRNKGKIKEIHDIFSSLEEINILSLDDFKNAPVVIEDGNSFAENAVQKAAATSRFTGIAALADDSGLVIDALKGEPGIYSARFGGDNATDLDRSRLILNNMKDVPTAQRSARFVCAIAIVFPDGKEYVTDGICEGMIHHEMRGNNGFGYDPIFYLPELGKTMAELTLDEKNRISHRAKAIEKAKDILEKIINR